MRTLFVTLLFLLTSCRSTHSQSSLASLAPVELSYSRLATSQIHETEQSLRQELDSFLRNDAQDSANLSLALKDWLETLSLFAHVFPTRSKDDPYLRLLESAQFGVFLMQEAKRNPHQIEWTKACLADLSHPETQQYLQDLNVQYASRRKNAWMPRAYWFGVNFIPDLSGAFSVNFQDYMKAQKKALAADIARASGGDPLFPGQSLLLQDVRDRSEVLLRLGKRFPAVDESFAFPDEITLIHQAYSSILIKLDRYSSYIDAQEQAKASVLGKQIRKEWEIERLRSRSSAKS